MATSYSDRYRALVVSGMAGGVAGLPWKRKAEVKSPKVCLRQSLMFGHFTPVICSRNIRFDVWSNGSLHAQPPGDARTSYCKLVPRQATFFW